MKFYHLTNCNRTVTADGLAFNFAPYERTSTWLGVYATEKEAEIKALDIAAADKKTGVTVITEQEYNICVKKKMGASSGYAPSLAVSVPLPNQAPADSVGDPLDSNPTPPTQEPTGPLESVDEAIKVVQVENGRRRK